MGHNLKGFTGKSTQPAVELRISGLGRRNTLIYEALASEDMNRGDSGIGDSREFTREEITAALKKISRKIDAQEEKDFLMDCLNAMSNDKIKILFE